ncbi:MAG: 30S ribosome-binding factor RbfA [Planctomycetales bacterium]|nr:30S ribosome-binding factor RbfA [bacterium]UNM09766.1 MAG: 30S ribosome-binding factor RbfA [Planctomycetales bacterium]
MGRASHKRQARIESLVLRTISEIISGELSDPRIEGYSITKVDVSPDLAHAEVGISTLAGGERTKECVEALNRASGLIWGRLREETDLRIVPRLRFMEDHSLQYAAEVEKLLNEIPDYRDDYSSLEEE